MQTSPGRPCPYQHNPNPMRDNVMPLWGPCKLPVQPDTRQHHPSHMDRPVSTIEGGRKLQCTSPRTVCKTGGLGPLACMQQQCSFHALGTLSVPGTTAADCDSAVRPRRRGWNEEVPHVTSRGRDPSGAQRSVRSAASAHPVPYHLYIHLDG